MKTAYQKLPRYLRVYVDKRVAGTRSTQAVREIRPHVKRPDDTAYDWNKRPEVQEAFEERCAEAERDASVTSARVVAELANVAFGDIRQLFNDKGELKPLHELPADVAAQLAGVDVEELFEGRGEEREQVGIVKRVKRWDKVKALELLGKRLKLWVDKSELDLGKMTLEQLLAASRKTE